MLKIGWKSFISFVVMMTALSAIIVQHGVDAKFRGYPLPFLVIQSGIGEETYYGWRIPNLLLSLGLCATIATLARTASRWRVPAKGWLFAGGAFLLIIGIAVCCLWHSVESPITSAEKLEQAATISTTIRHVLGAGVLIAAGFFFVFFLKKQTQEASQ